MVQYHHIHLEFLKDQMVQQQFDVDMEYGPQTVLTAIAKVAHQIPNHTVLEDMTHQALTYRRLLMGTDLLAAQWKAHLERDVPWQAVDAAGTASFGPARATPDSAADMPHRPTNSRRVSMVAPSTRWSASPGRAPS